MHRYIKRSLVQCSRIAGCITARPQSAVPAWQRHFSAPAAVPTSPPPHQIGTPSPSSSQLTTAFLPKTSIDAFNDVSLDVNGVELRGSVLLFPNYSLLWKPRTLDQVTVDSLVALSLASPRPETLLIGHDSSGSFLSASVRQYLMDLGIVAEITRRSVAATTFNVLNQEDRNVVAALLCDTDDDQVESMLAADARTPPSDTKPPAPPRAPPREGVVEEIYKT